MSEDDKTPKLGRVATPPGGVRRVQSQDDRSLKAMQRQRQERAQSQTVFVSPDDDLTDQYEVGTIDRATLRERRENRPTPQRLSHLEERVDNVVGSIASARTDLSNGITAVRTDLSKEITAVRTDMTREMGNVTNALANLTGSVTGLKTVLETQREREHITFKAEVDVATAEKKAEIAVDTAERKDAIAAKRKKRDTILKIIGGALGSVTVWEILKHLVERL